MPIICFEGASAVGKTTTADALRVLDDAYVVAEVNQLYARPEDEPADWYFERQVERWSIAQAQSGAHPLVILDGDPFQPLWYNWAYDFVAWHDLDFMEQFYRPRVRSGMIGFPSLYIIFSAAEAELRKRKESDAARRRQGFEAHLRMIEPQRRYFRAMQTFSPRRVLFLETETIEANMKFIRDNASALAGREEALAEREEAESVELLDRMIEWLRGNKP